MVAHTGLDLARPDSNGWHAVAAFAHRALGAAKGRIAGVRIDILPGAVIRGVENQGVLVQFQFAQLVHDVTDARVQFHHRVGVLGLGKRLMLKLGRRKVGLVDLHEVDVDEERLVRILGSLFQELQARLLDVLVQEGDTDHALVRGVHILAVDLPVLFGRFARLARKRSLGHLVEHFAQLRVHVRKPLRIAVGVSVEVVE